MGPLQIVAQAARRLLISGSYVRLLPWRRFLAQNGEIVSQTSDEWSLFAPPTEVPSALPTKTRAQRLPFEDLSWENFERLCHRLALAETTIEHCARFGLPGQLQSGIDIFGRYPDLTYHCWQAKRHKKYGARAIRLAVDAFLSGEWASKCVKFTIAAQPSLGDTATQREIENQTARLRPMGIALSVLGGDELTQQLRPHPELIDDFFGRVWVKALLGGEVASRLRERLDGKELALVRKQLGAVYDQQFHLIDPGSFAALGEEERPPLGLLDRFLPPDLVVRQKRERSSTGEGPADATVRSSSARELEAKSSNQLPRKEILSRRISLAEWIANGDKFAFVGEAGSGKSTLLRCVALDLLGTQSQFPSLAERWGDLLPLHLPFARWAREVVKVGGQVGLKEIVRLTLQPLLTAELVSLVDRAVEERRILLLVDGLDEWADEQGARTALHELLTFVGAHNIPSIISARPRGLNKIGAIPADWRTAEIAPLSLAQQRILSSRWFDRYAVSAVSEQERSGLVTVRTDQFMAELSRDRGLATLAEIPLLLVGLITLSLRGQILPRNKVDAHRQLVNLLLEQHPKSRATASGDVLDRFRHAKDPEQRRAALARLAFAVRLEAGDAGFPVPDARRILREFLSSTAGFELEVPLAAAAADEILAVNAETQGLLVEKAPAEVGFAHASFEEFLSAEYVASWPFADVESFVGTQAGNPRWRNVILNLLATTARRDEFSTLVAAIEANTGDALGDAYRQGLLAEVGFASANRSPPIAKRLVDDGIRQIELGDWLPARRDALASALNSLGDPTFGGQIEARLQRWTPCYSDWRQSLFGALSKWRPADDLSDALWRALHDEQRSAQRASASALAECYGGSRQIADLLIDGVHKSQRISTASAILEALRLGWPDHPSAASLFATAAESRSLTLQLVGIAGQLGRSVPVDDAPKKLLTALHFSSDLDFSDKPLAIGLLIDHFSDDQDLITSAIEALSGGYPDRGIWEHGDAAMYLLSCSTEHSEIQAWVKRELEERFPFNLVSLGSSHPWKLVARHVATDQAIKAKVVAHWQNEENSRFHSRDLAHLVSVTAIDDLLPLLMERGSDASSFDQYWAVMGLMQGWGLTHPVVGKYLADIPRRPDKELINLASLLPALIEDRPKCRKRLLTLGTNGAVRRDLLAAGLADCGCDGSDEEAVSAILTKPDRDAPAFRGVDRLFQNFSSNRRVRELALDDLDSANPSVESIAAGFENDGEVRSRVLDYCAPLPLALRIQIADSATLDPGTPAFSRLLALYDTESDADLKVRLSAGYHKSLLPSQIGSDTTTKLISDMKVGGPDHGARGAAAAVGLLTIGKLDLLKDEISPYSNKPIKIVVDEPLNPMPSVREELSEHWQQVINAFGPDWQERLESRTDSGVSKLLAAAAARSPLARAEFLARFESCELPATIENLRAYARERPQGERLFDRCVEAIDSHSGRNDNVERRSQVAILLREQFPHHPTLTSRFIDRLKEHRFADAALLLAIYSPESVKSVDWKFRPIEVATQYFDWATALHLSAAMDSCEDFKIVLKVVLARPRYTHWDLQPISNMAVIDRLRREGDNCTWLDDWLQPATEPTLLVNAARYLSAAGLLNSNHRALVVDWLQKLLASTVVPLAVYDAISARARSASLCVLDALHGENAS